MALTPRLFAIGDLHLALGTPNKSMERFGPAWHDHASRVAADWSARVDPDDIVLVPGDISWALKLPSAEPDLDYLRRLPGHKVLCRGNHDYWWSSTGKVRRALGDEADAVQGDAIALGPYAIGGTRLWDVPGLRFGHLIDWRPTEDGDDSLRTERTDEEIAHDEKIYRRELGRLDRALADLDRVDPDRRLHRIAMVHYPPISAELDPAPLADRFARAGVKDVVFGHLHAIADAHRGTLFGERDGIRYHLTSCDYLGCELLDLTPGA